MRGGGGIRSWRVIPAIGRQHQGHLHCVDCGRTFTPEEVAAGPRRVSFEERLRQLGELGPDEEHCGFEYDEPDHSVSELEGSNVIQFPGP